VTEPGVLWGAMSFSLSQHCIEHARKSKTSIARVKQEFLYTFRVARTLTFFARVLNSSGDSEKQQSNPQRGAIDFEQSKLLTGIDAPARAFCQATTELKNARAERVRLVRFAGIASKGV